MRQVAVSGGEVRVLEVPAPVVRPGGVLVRTHFSVISVGTESASTGGGGGEGLLMKAVRNPALVRKVIDRVSTHGLQSTLELVRTKISNDQATGYSCAGVVLEVGDGVEGLSVGDRVACAGAGYANHAAINFVPAILTARVFDGLALDEAAFATLGAIALQGVRRCAPTLGERVVVLGLGLIGQITAQLLRANGCVVLGVDTRRDRVDRALSLGMKDGFAVGERDFANGILERTDGHGADAVIVTAAGGDSSLLNRAFEACRRKGRVVLVGDVPIRIQRDRIYKKELDFLISTSYGPGRYDSEYEEKGHDYPFGYVRWTEGRNLSEVLRLMASGALSVRPLIDVVRPVETASEAYASLAAEPRPLGVVLTYEPIAASESTGRTLLATRVTRSKAGAHRVGVIGYGKYFRSMLLPLLRGRPGVQLTSVCARTGLAVRSAVEKDGFSRGTTDYREMLADPEIDVVYIATRHDQHYPIACAAIEAGKAVFVEKPMTMTSAEGRDLVERVAKHKALLTVGFNRRFSPHVVRLRETLVPIAAPRTMLYRVNAGALPEGHWLFDPVEGGGRLLGEGVHYFDLMRFIAGSEIREITSATGPHSRDEGTVTLSFADGSIGTLVYAIGGSADAGKERLEIFSGGATFVLDDFRSLAAFGVSMPTFRTRSIEKGQAAQLENFARALHGEAALGVTAEDGYWATWCAEKATSPK